LVRDEILYEAYNVATGSSIDAPRLIMLDQSLSGIMAAASHGSNPGLTGYPYDRRELDAADVMIEPSLMMPGIIISSIFSEQRSLVFRATPLQNQFSGAEEPVDNHTNRFGV
jgi:hypothetical protein